MAAQDPFDATVSSLYETVLNPGHWSVALKDVSTLFEASRAALFEFDLVANAPSNFCVHGFEADVQKLYAGYYHQLDPARTLAIPARVGEWLADEAVLDVHSRSAREYVIDYALPNDIGHLAGCKITGDSQGFQFLSLIRPPAAGRFGEAARRTHAGLQPHLTRMRQLQNRIDVLTAGSALAHATLNRLQAAVVLVDRRRKVHLVNDHGFKLLAAGREVAIVQRQLVCREPYLDERLGRAIAGACREAACGGALRVTRGTEPSDLLLMILPVPRHHELASTLSEPLALVVASDPAAEHAPVEVYRALFSLSNAEAALLTALVRGVPVAEWCAQRGIATSTVRTQLRALFEKTGVDSQARLVALAKSIPPIG